MCCGPVPSIPFPQVAQAKKLGASVDAAYEKLVECVPQLGESFTLLGKATLRADAELCPVRSIIILAPSRPAA